MERPTKQFLELLNNHKVKSFKNADYEITFFEEQTQPLAIPETMTDNSKEVKPSYEQLLFGSSV